ncbi:hypothetical protein [Virgibacillus ainsalahensis]
MTEDTQQKKSKFLRLVSPKLYNYILNQFEDEYNIHSYDFQAEGIKEETGILVLLRFGEQYTHIKEHFFSFEAIKEEKDELDEFVKEAGEYCTEILIADYYKMMEPK